MVNHLRNHKAETANSSTYLIEVTSHPLATAYLHILLPRKPLPPQTTSFFVGVAIFVVEVKPVVVLRKKLPRSID